MKKKIKNLHVRSNLEGFEGLKTVACSKTLTGALHEGL